MLKFLYNKIKLSYSKKTIVGNIILSYLAIILVLVMQNILSLYISSNIQNRYSNVIKNMTDANSLIKEIKPPIDAEAYEVYAGRSDFSNGNEKNLYTQIENIGNHIISLKDSSVSPDSYQTLEVIERTLDTLTTYVSRMDQNIQNNAPVSENEEIYEEIRSVTTLLDDIMSDFMTSEINHIEQISLEISRTSDTLEVVNTVVIIITSVFAFYSLLSIARRIVKPITDLTGFASSIGEGNFKARVKSTSTDELGELAGAFNTMAEKIDGLITQNEQKQKELQKSEMRTLQSQITPHFLYNTLDTITWMAESGRNSDVIKITVALSNFFRITLSRGDDWVRLADEIEHVHSYLIIQRIRYRDILDFEINYDDELLSDYCCLKLILQPLVENALYHGIKYSRERGKITVSADKKGDMIYCEVIDNGAGMKPERLQEVLAMLNQDFDKNAQNNKSFGLYNVHKRLQLYYNMEEGLSIESAPNEGTKVSFSIPAYCRDDIEE